MIMSFRDDRARLLFDGIVPKSIPIGLAKIARRKLEMINAAKQLSDLKSPPGNELHALNADRAGQYSIRINRQYRVCFRWQGDGVYDVEIVDYH
jgi:proteic killer suppression protein